EDPLVSAALALDLSGLDYLRAIADGRIAAPPIAVLLGRGIVGVQPGRVMFSLEVGEHLYTPSGSVHGGVFCALLDSAMGCAAHSVLDRGQAYATLELKANLVKALTVNTPGGVATGREIAPPRPPPPRPRAAPPATRNRGKRAWPRSPAPPVLRTGECSAAQVPAHGLA